MKIAIFVNSHQSLRLSPVEEADRFAWMDLDTIALGNYDAVFLIGSPTLDKSSVLSPEACAKLWAFAEQGGRIYAELVEAFDFSSSRLFGWKQDFQATRRTIEKLRNDRDIEGMAAGELLEWSGPMLRGFTFDSEVKLSFGVYQETHRSEERGGGALPGLIVRRLGAGTVVYAAFSLFSCSDPETLRPYSRWAPFIQHLAEETGLPLRMWAPLIGMGGHVTARQSVEANLDWFISSGMLPSADGSKGVYENIHSVTAKLSPDRRPDCHAHTALMFHLYGRWKNDEKWLAASDHLLHYLFEEGFQDMDPLSPSYGFFKWYDFPGAYPHQLFTDDNAWVCFVLLYLYRKTGKEIYRERGMLVAEGLLSTQRPDGLRPNCLTRGQLAELGRAGVRELEPSLNPHFESITHAAFIQAYLVTGENAYLETAVTGARTLLARRDEFKFMYSRTSGLTRLLLPLGFLAGHDHTGELEAGLRQTVEYLTAHQHSLGGIEEADNPDPERFGQEDAGVYIANGEGIADQLYTNNFLVMNSWEAWRATGNPQYKQLHDEVAAFMQHIQIRSADGRYNGGWMRAFDLNKAEYFGNNGDTGWGPYCMESGWTNAITSAGLLLALLDESVFD
ncbi:hypothetical protein [Paenibacillus abyssi]|uniref:Uncharacterized protein n=1 Tax=Paenibacillus abyssi TaxID=1340531 RepID=A0A917G0X6_9BACL|nr:hypothetical protein [Paenibacillus abyssi]GGG17237.1 hypothetical protein GCM10010916_37620 [Paenibacillus abyssi]